jgi:hypothetical protein
VTRPYTCYFNPAWRSCTPPDAGYQAEVCSMMHSSQSPKIRTILKRLCFFGDGLNQQRFASGLPLRILGATFFLWQVAPE